MIEGQPTMDLWSVDIRRLHPLRNLAFLRGVLRKCSGCTISRLGRTVNLKRARTPKITPPRRPAQGARSESRTDGTPELPARDEQGRDKYSFGRQNWFACHAAEHCAARVNESPSLIRPAFPNTFSNAMLNVLQRLCGNDVDVPIGRAVYTGMFNERGGFESDLTLVRLGPDEYSLITGTAQTVRDFYWITRHIEEDEHAELVDVTSAYCVIGAMGPHSRDLLSRVTDADLSNDAFPFGTAKIIGVGCATVRAVRLTYVGELGWELHVPMDQAALTFDTLMKAGGDWGLANAGHYAINSLRLEKGYRAWGAELSPDDTPLEAGLSFAIAWTKPIPFIGREALLEQKMNGVKRQLVIFVLDDPEPMLWGGEPIYRDGKVVGYTTSGSYGHRWSIAWVT
jgi:4-methylaminobutanoate oxidase (formaldehyde-forming)